MSIYEGIGIGYLVFCTTLATIAIIYLAIVGLRSVLNKEKRPEPAAAAAWRER